MPWRTRNSGSPTHGQPLRRRGELRPESGRLAGRRTVYVSRGHKADVVAIDLETGELRWRSETDGYRADHQVISGDGRYLYTSAVTADAVHKIDTEDGEIVGSVEVTTFPHGNHLHEVPGMGDGSTLVNGSLGNLLVPDEADGDHRLTFVDADTLEVRRTVDYEEGVRPFVFSPDARKVYVQISHLHGFHESDVVEDRVTRTKHLPEAEHVPDDEDDYPLESAHHGIDVSGDGEYACVAGTTSWYAAVVRRRDLALVDAIEVGEHPCWVQIAPGGDRAFVAVEGEDTVSVIDYPEATEVERIPVEDDPMVVEHRPVHESALSPRSPAPVTRSSPASGSATGRSVGSMWLARVGTSPGATDRSPSERPPGAGTAGPTLRAVDVDRFEPDVVDRSVVRVRLDGADGADDVHPLGHLAEHRVPVV